MLDATQNLVQALVKSVQQASTSQPAAPAGLAATPLLQHGPEINPGAITPLPTVPWTVPRGAQLQAVLTDWCHRAGWTLVWQSEYSYRVEAAASFDGDFVSAVTAMFSAMKNVSPAIYPDIYKGNRVVVVKNDPTR